MCVYSAPRSRPGAAEEGAGLGGAASRGRGRAWSDGGRARKISFPNLLPLLLHTPPRSLLCLSHSLPLGELLGVNGVFLLLRKMEPAAAEDRGGRRRGRPGAGSIFIQAAPSFPQQLRARRARGAGTGGRTAPWASSPAWAAAPARLPVAGRREALRRIRGPDRGEPHHRTPGSAERRRPASPVAAGGLRDGGLWRRVGWGGFGFFFFRFYFCPGVSSLTTFFPLRGASLPESPRKQLLGVGAAGWRALRWRWAWPVARAGGAVARRPPSSLAARAAPNVEARPGPPPPLPKPGSPGATLGPPGPCGWS